MSHLQVFPSFARAWEMAIRDTMVTAYTTALAGQVDPHPNEVPFSKSDLNFGHLVNYIGMSQNDQENTAPFSKL